MKHMLCLTLLNGWKSYKLFMKFYSRMFSFLIKTIMLQVPTNIMEKKKFVLQLQKSSLVSAELDQEIWTLRVKQFQRAN